MIFHCKHGSERSSPGVRRLPGVHESRVEHGERGSDGFVYRTGGDRPYRPHSLRHYPPPLGQEEGPGGDLPGAAVSGVHGGGAAGGHDRQPDAGGRLVPLPPAHHRVAVSRRRADPGHVPDAGPVFRRAHLLLLHRGQEHEDGPRAVHLLPVRAGAERLRVRARGDPRPRSAARRHRQGVPGVSGGAAEDPVPGGAGHLPQDPQPGTPGPRHQDPQRLRVHQEPVQPDVCGERAAAAVAGGPAGAEPGEHRGAAAGEGEAAAGAGRSVSREGQSSVKTTFCFARCSFLTIFLSSHAGLGRTSVLCWYRSLTG